MRRLFFAILCFAVSAVAAADDVHYHNGVKCVRKLVPIVGSSHHRVVYEPVVSQSTDVVVSQSVEQVAPPAYPTEQELLGYSQADYEKRLLAIIERAVRDQSRRADIKLLRDLGLDLGGHHADKYSVYSKSVYDRGYESPRPAESNFGISVRESVDFIGADPTDVIAEQIGRNLDGVRDLFGDLSDSQAQALRDLIQSRAVNTERIARAVEETAKGQADATRIRALSEATRRSSTDRDINITGTFLNHLAAQLQGSSGAALPSVGGGGGSVTGNAATPNNEASQRLQTVVNQKCGKCHIPGGAAYTADRLNMSNYSSLTFDQLSNIVSKVRGGTMPPQSEPALSQEELGIIVDDFVNVSLNLKE